MYIFCSLRSTLSLIWGSCFNTKLSKYKFKFWWLHHKNNFPRISSILATFVMKKTFSSGVIVSVNRRRKAIQVTFVSFGLHAWRFTVECTEYGNTLFSYFDIFISVSSNFTLNSRITGYLQCRVGFTPTLSILIWLIFE